MSSRILADPARTASLLILVVGAATIAGALTSQYGFGYIPCELCLLQRWPYYAGVPLAAVTLLVPASLRRLGLATLALVFAVSAGLGLYHAGVEWGWWLGPADCGGGGQVGSFADFARALDKARVVSCTEAAFRVLGLSLAGWNAVISAGLAAFAAWVAARWASPYGSSSVSQYR